MLTYAGIGARATPEHVLKVMYDTAILLARDGYMCNTGAAPGADQEFAKGAIAGNGNVSFMLPWNTYEKDWVTMITNMPTGRVLIHTLSALNPSAYMSVQQLHPAYEKIKHKQGLIKLHARNYMIINNARFVICWTPNGKTIGGTGQGIRIAESLNIHIYNLGNPNVLAAFEDKLEKIKNELL